MQSSQQTRVKILLKETDETFLVPQPMEELEFDALISYIKLKVSKSKNYEIFFVALPKNLLLENESDFLRYKTSVLGRGEKSVKFLVQEFGTNVEAQSMRKSSKDSDRSDSSVQSDWKFSCQGDHHANYSGTLYQCAICVDYFVCEKCEGKGIHETHPMIKILNKTQYKLLQNAKQGKLQKIVEQFKNSNPLKNIQKKFNQFGKLFCESDKSEKEDSEAYILKMKSTLLGSMVDSEPEKFTQLVQDNPDKDVESLVQMVLQEPQKFGLGL